ncbi:MAG: HEAT repeat domain-containing protein [Treponema sp.]|jgi:hypothetical protein|nr:HEAT repeat domain-containing protein [Treponema sp.]
MIGVKRFIAAAGVFFTSAMLLMGQDKQEMSVEESYLQESMDFLIIREQSRADNREAKLAALDYIGQAIEGGKTGEDVRSALEYLAMDGILNKTTENGRLINNNPDIRLKAATYLGELGTAEAKDTLIKLLLIDPEPMVLTETVKSLGKIGLNDNNETVNAISWIVTRFDVLNPDNLLALSALDTYEILADKDGGIKDATALRSIIRIADGRYIKPVQERARQLLAKLRKYSVQNQNQQSSR